MDFWFHHKVYYFLAAIKHKQKVLFGKKSSLRMVTVDSSYGYSCGMMF